MAYAPTSPCPHSSTAGLNEEQIAALRGAAEAPLRMEPRDAAARIVSALKRRKKRVLVGEDVKVVARVQRLCPLNYGPVLAAVQGQEI